MVNFDILVPFIKRALANSENVSPEEVFAVLNESNKNNGDQNTETIDGELMDKTDQTTEEAKNEEGKVLEHAFKDLEIEEAIKTVKERKEVEIDKISEDTTPQSAWDLMKAIYGNNRR